MPITDKHGVPMTASARPRAEVGQPSYAGANTWDGSLAGWSPTRRSADGELLLEFDELVARARDLVRNSGIASAAVRKAADFVIGRGWKLAPMVDHEALGLDRETARAVGRACAIVWREWSDDPRKRCHGARKHNFAGVCRELYRERRTAGECLAILRWRTRFDWRYATFLQTVDPIRLSNPLGTPNTATMRNGIELDEDGVAIAYHIREGNQYDPWPDPEAFTWTRVPREEGTGRPVVLHSFEVERAEQSRGVTPFAALMADFKGLTRHKEAHLARAIVHAMFAAFIKSGMDPASVAELLDATAGNAPASIATAWQEQRAAYYEKAPVRMTPGAPRIPVLPVGDEIELNAAAGEPGQFAPFRDAFLQEIATCLGLPHPVLAENWAGVNYSSARAALNEAWRWRTGEHADFESEIVAPTYYAVMEEAFARGIITPPPDAPLFEDAPWAYTRARWIGPGRGYVDKVKEVQGSTMAIDGGLALRADELAERGYTLEEFAEARAAEEAELNARGLQFISAAPAPGLPAPSEEEGAASPADA